MKELLNGEFKDLRPLVKYGLTSDAYFRLVPEFRQRVDEFMTKAGIQLPILEEAATPVVQVLSEPCESCSA